MTDQPIGVCIVLKNEAGEILFGRRKSGYRPGEYGLPGGRVEIGEPLLQAAERELGEETGLTIGDFQYVGVVREYQNGIDFIHFVFSASTDEKPRVTEPDKCEKWEWFEQSQIPDDALPAHREAVFLMQRNTFLSDLNF